MREMLAGQVEVALQTHGYTVRSFVPFHSCFDIVAAHTQLSGLVIKVFSNIDALRPEQAGELSRIAALFCAQPLLIGEKTKAGQLEAHTQYERFGIAAQSFETFNGYLDGRLPVSQSYRAQESVLLNGEKLRFERRMRKWRLSDVAARIGVCAQTIHRYENGLPASRLQAQKLEALLDASLVLPSTRTQTAVHSKKLFSTRFSDSALEKIHDLGLEMAVFSHAPFQALAHPDETLLIGIGKERKEIYRKAFVLKQTQEVFNTHRVVIAKADATRAQTVSPVVCESELPSYSDYADFLSEIVAREQKLQTKNAG